MNNSYLIFSTTLIMLASSACDKQGATAQKISELERKNSEAEERQRDLERQIEDQKLASERDAIERERARIEEDRAAYELQKGDASAAQDSAIRKREAALAEREGKLDDVQATLEKNQDAQLARGQKLTERDRELAGREALPFQQNEQSAPVADPWSCVKRTGGPTRGVVGFVAIEAGRGCRRSPLAGRLITTGGGPCCVDVDGSGCQVRSGLLVGSHGVKMPITSAGHRYRPRLSPTVVKAGALVWTCSLISVRRGLTSSE